MPQQDQPINMHAKVNFSKIAPDFQKTGKRIGKRQFI